MFLRMHLFVEAQASLEFPYKSTILELTQETGLSSRLQSGAYQPLWRLSRRTRDLGGLIQPQHSLSTAESLCFLRV